LGRLDGRAGGVVRVGAIAGALVAVGTVAFLAPYRGSAPSVLVRVVANTVLVSRDGSSYAPVSSTTTLDAGQSLRTDNHGRALLTYFDGTTVLIGEESEFSYVVSQTTLGEIVVTMLQSAGRMWYRIARALSPGARYEVHFPVGAAVVRAGSAMDAVVGEDGATTVVASEGSIDVSSGGRSVPLRPGEQTVVKRGATPSTPTTNPETATTSPAPTAGPTANATPSSTPAPTSPPSLPIVLPSIMPTPTPTPTLTPTPTPTPTGSPSPVPSLLPSASPIPTSNPAPSILPSLSAPPLPTPTLPALP